MAQTNIMNNHGPQVEAINWMDGRYTVYNSENPEAWIDCENPLTLPESHGPVRDI